MRKLMLMMGLLLATTANAQNTTVPNEGASPSTVVDLDKVAETLIGPEFLDAFHHIRLANTEMNIVGLVDTKGKPEFANLTIYADNPVNWTRLMTYEIVPLEKTLGGSIKKSAEIVEAMASEYELFERYNKVGLTGAFFYKKVGSESVVGYAVPVNQHQMIIARYHTKGIVYYVDLNKMAALSGLSPRIEKFMMIAPQ